MIKRSSQPLCAWFLGWDLALTAAAWLAAYHVRFSTGWLPPNGEVPSFSLCLSTLPQVLLCAAVAFRMAGQYQVHRLRRFREEVVAVARGVGLLLLLAVATSFSLHDGYESRVTMLVFAGLAGSSILVARRLTWSALRALRARGYNQSRAIIVGTGRLARQTARALRHASWMGIRNVGFVEDNPSRGCAGLNVLGGIDQLPELVQQARAEHVFIALPMARFAEVRRAFDALSQSMVEVRVILDAPALAGLSLTTSNLDGMAVVGLRESPHFGLNVIVKRVMDVALAAVAVVLLAPVLFVIAALVKLTSPGPVLYRQERCGLNGKPFSMLKFRSMRADAEADGKAGWSKKNDDRRTWFGSFLRKTNLDELPQLFNVLAGDMSLVGPRPERPVFIQQFRKTIPNYMARHCVKAGMTGWAQVHGWRGDTSLRKRIQFDLYYITHWTPLLDIRIIVLTALKMFFSRNAF